MWWNFKRKKKDLVSSIEVIIPLLNPLNKITVTDIKPSQPEFRRQYKGIVGVDIEISITARTWVTIGFDRSYSGELKQRNGRWILFEPKRPADKILDRDLLPEINSFCEQVIEQDLLFIKSEPDTFTDETGQIWRKISHT